MNELKDEMTPSEDSTEPIQDDLETELREDLTRFPFEGGVIVFGHGWSRKNKLGGGWQLSTEAWIRAVGAYQLWHEGLTPRIILTGGQPGERDKEKHGSDIIANSEQMADFLEKKFNVPRSAIVTETLSTKTVDNVAHALNQLQQKGAPCDNFLTVSTGYHMDRITNIMEKFNLHSQPVSAEAGLNERALEHAMKMKAKEIEKGMDPIEIERRFQIRKRRYEKVLEKLHRVNEKIKQEVGAEETWLNAMKEIPGYWLPLALAVRGDKLKELTEVHKEEIEAWLERHPDIGVTFDDIVLGNFDYMELVAKGREMPK
ncbi:MAG: YdcF family protein [Candidatus Berkelbacteria bacterium]|nr:YdcF family protein [Candidatus Berkelbacteria bacterium]